MLLKQYRHRLPADYDISKFYDRAQKGGPAFDEREGLAFKAFCIEESGKSGALENAYSSFYLWFGSDPVVDFLWYEGFQNVLDTFGRPKVEMWLAIDARKGEGNAATMLYRENLEVPYGMSLNELHSTEVERSLETSSDPNVVASMVGLDPITWRLSRFILTQAPLVPPGRYQAYQVAYLAKPGLNRLI